MKYRLLAAVVLVTSAMATSEAVHAQARGLSAGEILESGQDIPSGREKREAAAMQAMEEAREKAAREREELRDPAVRARRLAELDAWSRRIPGRFRVGGIIKMLECRFGACTEVSDKVTGVADCVGIGEGVGVQCIISATWGLIETVLPGIGATPAGSELLRSFNPAVLVLGLNLDPPGIRATMVNAESLSHVWVGNLTGNNATINRVNPALMGRMIRSLQISAEPESDRVTIVAWTGSITLTLAMIRDPEARAEKPIKTLRWR